MGRVESVSQPINEKATVVGQWSIYLVRNALGHLYCGISTDVERRVAQHACGKGAKSLRGKGPLHLVWARTAESHSQALIYEAKIKRLSKTKKEALVQNKFDIFA